MADRVNENEEVVSQDEVPEVEVQQPEEGNTGSGTSG